MRNFAIVTDSSCDLPIELIEKYDLIVAQLDVVVEGEEPKPNNEVDIKEFYAKLRGGKGAKTAAANMDKFTTLFEKPLSEGKDVLYLGFSTGLSATYMAGVNAAEDLKAKYPERKILTSDTLCASLGQGMLVYLCCEKAEAGASIEEVYKYAEEIKPNLCHWFTVDDLFFLKRGGRINAATAIAGSLLSIKPVLHVDDAGKLISVSKARGRKASIVALFNQMEKTVINPREQVIFISHGDCLEDAQFLADMIKEKLGVIDVIINPVGPVIGAHSGPGTLALFFLGTQR